MCGLDDLSPHPYQAGILVPFTEEELRLRDEKLVVQGDTTRVEELGFKSRSVWPQSR